MKLVEIAVFYAVTFPTGDLEFDLEFDLEYDW